MAYRFTARAVSGVFSREKSFRECAGSFTIVQWPDGSSRFGAPTELEWLTDVERLPDMVDLSYPCVSARLRDLIERYDPGVHLFYPLTVTMKDGFAEQRYLLRVNHEFDAVSEEHSNWTRKFERYWTQPSSRERRLVFDARLIGDANLWRTTGLGTEMNPLASNRLSEAAQAAEMTGLLLTPYDDTDQDGRYVAPPLSVDRVYSVGARTRCLPGGSIPLTVKVKLLDGKPKEIRFADDPDGSPMLLSSAWGRGQHLDARNVSTKCYYYQNSKGVPPDIYIYDMLPLTVSTRFKELIERFEPGVHQFLPISFVDKKDNVVEERHILVIGSLLDTISREHSTFLGEKSPYNPGHEQGTIVVGRASVAGRHLWRDQWLGGNLYVSNEIADVMEESGWPDLSFGGLDLVD